MLCRGGSSESEEDSDEVLGGRFCFLGFLGEGCLTRGLGLFTEPLGRPRGRFVGAAAGAAASGVLTSSAVPAGSAAAASTLGVFVQRFARDFHYFLLLGLILSFSNLLNGLRRKE